MMLEIFMMAMEVTMASRMRVHDMAQLKSETISNLFSVDG